MGLVKYIKTSQQKYDSLEKKDEDTIYVVNSTGDFSENNTEGIARLYIGEKEIYNYKGIPVIKIIPDGTINLDPDIKYLIEVHDKDINVTLSPNINNKYNHYYKATLFVYRETPEITFPSNISWENPLQIIKYSKYIIIIEDEVATFIKADMVVDPSFSDGFSSDFMNIRDDDLNNE